MKFTQRAMQMATGTLFGRADNLAIVDTQREIDKSQEWNFKREERAYRRGGADFSIIPRNREANLRDQDSQCVYNW